MRRKRKMARQLIKTTDVWLVENEEEAMEMIEEAKEKQAQGGYTVTKSGYTVKQKKDYTEYKVTIERTFD